MKRKLTKKEILDNSNSCPKCGAEMYEEEDIDGYGCLECGYQK